MWIPLLIGAGFLYLASRRDEAKVPSKGEDPKPTEDTAGGPPPYLDAPKDKIVEGLSASSCLGTGVDRALSWHQLNLMNLGYLSINGDLVGSCQGATRDAIRDFQKVNGMAVTGVISKDVSARMPGYWTVRPIGNFRESSSVGDAFGYYGIAAPGASFDPSRAEFDELLAVVAVKDGKISKVLTAKKGSGLPTVHVGDYAIFSSYQPLYKAFRRHVYDPKKKTWVSVLLSPIGS